MSRLANLADIGRRLSSALDVERVCSIALEDVLALTEAVGGAWVWAVASPEGFDVLTSDSSITAETWKRVVEKAGRPAAPRTVRLDAETPGLCGTVLVPVAMDSRSGWLMVGYAEEMPRAEEVILITSIAEMARMAAIGRVRTSVAVEGAGPRSEVSGIGLEMMASWQRVSRTITSTIDLDHVLRVVLDEATSFSEAAVGFIVTFSGDDIALRVARGYDQPTLTRLGTGAADLVEDLQLRAKLAGGETLHLSGAELAGPPILRDAGTVLITPVFYEQGLAAAILIQSPSPEGFGPAVPEFMEGLALQASIAVGNARRFEEQLRRGELMHQRAEQMALLLEVTRTMRSDRPLEDVLLDIAYAVQESIGFDIVLISVLEGNMLRRVAGAGIPLKELAEHKKVRLPWKRVRQLCREQFQIGQCYYIPASYGTQLLDGLDVFVPEPLEKHGGPDMWQVEDVFFVPLKASTGDVLGIMSVDRPRDGKAPTPMTAEVIEIFASQVALAIENNRLVESLRRQVTTLQLFNELNRSITTKLDLPLVLNTVVQSVTNVLGYDFSTVFLWEDKGKQFVPKASSGYAIELLDGTPIDSEGGFISEIVRTSMPLVMEDAKADARFASADVPIGSSVGVPLVVEGRTVGILTADRKEKGEFSPADVATMTALADQVAVAVENARLFEEVKRFNEELELRVVERTQELAEALERLRFQRDRSEVLYHIASELVASLDMDRVLSQALLLLQRAVQASRSSVILLDNSTGQLVYRAAIGHTRPIPPGGKLAPFDRDEGIVGWVLRTKQALIIPDVLADERRMPADMEATRSVMAVPVMGSAGEALGVILLQSPIVNVFDETQMQLVEAAAVQLGNALNNAELYNLIREQAERLGMMLRNQQIEAAKNQSILEGIADGVMVADASGRIMLFNAAAERILSITRSQALGRQQEEILGLYGSEVHEWLSQIAAWQRKPNEYGSEAFLAQRLEVGRRSVSIHLSPVVSETGEFLGVVSVFRDITSEIEADRAKSEFVSTVSHELRTPMTSIVGYVDLILAGAGGDLTDTQLSFLKKVKANADRLTDLVNDLLDISRIEQGRVELQLEPLAMEEVIGQVIDLMRPKTEEKEQTLRTSIPEGLPKAYGDAARMTQILTNLVSNAYKYTPAGGEIAVHAYVRDRMMHVAVVDSGIGIAAENQKKIFERFYRVEDDPAVYEVSGTGLGLAITLSLIQMHGGDIWLESELGEGSIFTFSVPLAEGESARDLGAQPESLVIDSRPTVLVVEDDTQISELLKVTLESEGMDVLTAASGEVAVRVARQELPDLISLDIRLPDLDGFEVLQLLKREPETADIPVVIVSVVAERERGLKLGAIDYVTKPVDAYKLLDVVHRLLKEREVIVVADHDKSTLDKVRSALQTNGVGVRTTTRGEHALSLARKLRPAVMVLDLELPDLNGYQLVDRLRRHRQTAGIPIVVTTARTEDLQEEAERLRALGVRRLVAKPYSADELVADIHLLLDRNDAGKES
ncbi:MAG: GAF domain-containing protein [Anaerolineae bacterium]